MAHHQHQQQHGYWQPAPPLHSPPAEYHHYAYATHHGTHPQSEYPPQPLPYHQLPHPHYPYQGPQSPQHPQQPQQQQQQQYNEPRSPGHHSPPEFSMPGSFNSYGLPSDTAQMNIQDRPPSPQYVGRRGKSKPRSSVSSKSSETSKPVPFLESARPSRRKSRGRRKSAAPPGYKHPTVESVPNSPILLPCLSTDSESVMDDNPDYVRPEYTQPLEDERPVRVAAAAKNKKEWRPPAPEVSPLPPRNERETYERERKNTPPPPLQRLPVHEDRVELERDRTPYASSSATTSTAASSPPPEKFPLERERRQYANTLKPTQEVVGDDGRDYSRGGDSGDSRYPPDLGLERERRQYANVPEHDDHTHDHDREPRRYSGGGAAHREPERPNTPPRQPQPYSSSSSSGTAKRQNAQYSPPADLPHPQEEYPEIMPRQAQPYASSANTTSSRRPAQFNPANEQALPRETMPRTPQPYASAAPPVISTSTRRQAQQYSSSAADLAYPREDPRDLRMPSLPKVPPSPRHRQSPRPPESPHYAHSPLHTRSPQPPPTSRYQPPSPPPPPPRREPSPPPRREPEPEPEPIETFPTGSLVQQRSSTPQSEFLDLIPACPKRRPVSRGTWYGISSIPNFHVCEKCFEVHIYDSAFHKYFTEFKLADGEKTYCAFNTPRVLNFVWPTTVQANLFEVFTGFATGRSKIGTCTSLDSTAKQGTWYTIQGSSKGGFIACQACYEDVILASPFHKFFGALDAQVTENAISCHVAWPFIEARLLNTPSTWDEIQRDIEYRLFEVPACPGDKLIRDPGRRWWKPKGTSLPLYICDCCYWDGIFPTLFSGDFELVVQDRSAAWCCAMSGYQLSMVWQHAAEKKDLSIWLDAANAALSPMCSAQGSNGKIWNCIKDSASLDGFEFCERCTAVFIRSLGFGGRLEQRRYAPEETIKCQLHPSNEFQVLMLQKLGEAAAWREFGIFKQFLEQIASNMYKPQACPGTSLERRKRWWGCEGFNVCEDCWVRQVQPSAFAGFVKEVDLKGRSGENRCDLGTVDWKGIWKRKCEKGDFRNFLEAVELKHKLEEVRMDRAETVKEMMEKSRRGLFPDERRRLQSLLGDLEEEERDATNMLAVLTRG